MLRTIRPGGNAGISRVTAPESEQGFCVKAVRKPVELLFMPSSGIGKSCPGVRRDEQYIRTFADWSSSENNSNNAWKQRFSDGNQNNNNKTNTNSVRAVRDFTQSHVQEAPERRIRGCFGVSCLLTKGRYGAA
jgi:hypothetical protein